MEFTGRETWTLIQGLILGTFFLLAFAGGLAGLWSLRTEYVTPAGIAERVRRLKLGTAAMAGASWATVITGTWIVYYGPALARNRAARLLVLVVFVGAFATAAIAGLFGALITKTAPIA